MGFFNSKAVVRPASEVAEIHTAEVAKFDKPKILLLDIESNAFKALAGVGFNVKEGTFGQPYKVPMNSGFQPLLSEPRLPNYAEQEIVVVDLHYAVADQPVGEKFRPDGELDLWAKCDHGFIDPRMRAALEVQGSFDRTLNSGGVFVVFAASKTPNLIQTGRFRNRTLEVEQDCDWSEWSEWSFISELNDMEVSSSRGEEMSVVDLISPLGKLIKSHLSGSLYDCTIKGGFRLPDPWTVLVQNKFGQAVALQGSFGSKGSIIVLPQLKDKTSFLKSFFTDVLPEMAPHLFPGIEQGRWTHLSDYELPEVVQLHNQRSQLEAKFKADLAALEQEVLRAREQDGWMHDLLTQTGDPLVAAVKIGLKALGFSKVVDMDQVRDKQGKSRREDLQIQDISPTLVVDVKGIANFPGDEDVLQAGKHATLLMREQNRTDIFGLSLVNHQRHIPPMQRDNEMPFRLELLHVALESQLGLLTAWDFYRLVKNARLHKWEYESVRPVLYQHGRVEIIPAHYRYIGKVTKVWSDKFGVDIEYEAVAVGTRIAIEFHVLFEESDVEELMVDNNIVNVANVGDKTGIPWSNIKPKLKIGLRVFRIEQ
jgi:hypothetical protein